MHLPRGPRRRYLAGVSACAAVGVITTALVLPHAAAADLPNGPAPTPAAAPAPLVTAYRLEQSQLLGTVGDVRVAAVDTTACGALPVTTTGTGAGMRVTITGFSSPFTLGAIPTTWWARPPINSAVFSLYYAGLMWVGPIAKLAAVQQDTETINALVSAVSDVFQANPDVGAITGGWDEGSNLRRQQALNCLWRVSGGDTRLLPAIEATSAANMDMNRYYGLPKNPVHNHGLMANLALLDAGSLHQNSTWIDVALTRTARDSAGAWTPGGLAYEQSGSYGLFNTVLWGLAADAIAAYPGTQDTVGRIRADVTRARAAHAHLTTPAGAIVAYGDGGAAVGITTAQPQNAFRDDAAGVATGRWSWTDRTTSYYLLRYGGFRRMHGHQDRGALVWSTLGVPVLVDAQTYGNDLGIADAAWCRTAAAHNTQTPRGKVLDLRVPVTLTKASRTGSAHAYTLTDRLYGLAHTRGWLIDNARHLVRLTDITPSPATSMLHLDPAWTVKSTSKNHKTVTLVNGRRTLRVASTGTIVVYRGSRHPVAGWVYPAYGARRSAVQLAIATPAGRSVTTLTVS